MIAVYTILPNNEGKLWMMPNKAPPDYVLVQEFPTQPVWKAEEGTHSANMEIIVHTLPYQGFKWIGAVKEWAHLYQQKEDT